MTSNDMPGHGPADAAGASTETRGSARDDLKDLRHDARREAHGLAEGVRDHLQDRAEDARDSVADEVSSVGEALRTASQEMRRGSLQEQVFATMADSLADFADSMSGRDPDELVRSVSSFGRRNPVAFLGGATLLGFAASRMARASSRHPESTHRHDGMHTDAAPHCTAEAGSGGPLGRTPLSDTGEV
ncbi:hypothetical protein [Oceaniglobus roseus]|uniref:hypothetical protein n=1 Tax=Oceaniglobus roseus TaxID=1737570 RepID=UPI0012FFFA57|nr:hypothetical protein [Kandeliimicrobium roseum]